MKIILKPSLEHISLVNISAQLWSHTDIKNSMNIYLLYHNINLDWKEIENNVIKKVPHLPLPEPLKKKLSCFIKPIGREILNWINYHYIQHRIYLNLGVEFCWTPQGTIDRKKTAEMIIKDNTIDISMRYRLACLYCIEDDILEMQSKMPLGIIWEKSYVNENQNQMLFYWSDSNRVRRNNATTSYRSEIKACARDGNKEATCYFLQKLSLKKRDKYLVKIIDYVHFVYDANFLIYLLSQMDEEQQTKLFNTWPSKMFVCFLEWPFQNLFEEIPNCFMDFLCNMGISRLLNCFVIKLNSHYMECNYEKLFGNFVRKSSRNVKRHVIDYLIKNPDLFVQLFISEKENLKFLLQDASLSEKKNLIFGGEGNKYIFKLWLCDEKWDILRQFIKECLPSKTEMIKFKEEIERDSSFIFHHSLNRGKWDEIFSMPNESISNHNKRDCVADEGEQSKRIRLT